MTRDAQPRAAAPPTAVTAAEVREKLRVFHLIKSLGRGGAEMLLLESLRFADRERFHFGYGYFLPWKDAMVPALEAQEVGVSCFGGRNNLQILLAARRVAGHLRRFQADVLHCHLPIAGVVGRVAGRLAGVPVVYTEHNTQERYHGLTRWLNRATWTWQSRVIAVSREVAESIRRQMPASVPVEVVLNGVDVERFRRGPADAASVRARFGISDGAPVVGSVAVFRVQKGLQDWLAAARLLRERHPDVRFLMVGDGPLRAEVEARAGELGLREVVHLPGLQEDVRPFLAAMDVYLMSSLFEGLPVALLEAMSMECAPVCTAVGGIPEVIRAGENGLLVEPRRPQELARLAAGLLEDPPRARRLGAAARATVEQGFSMRRVARSLEALYTKVVDEHRHRR